MLAGGCTGVPVNLALYSTQFCFGKALWMMGFTLYPVSVNGAGQVRRPRQQGRRGHGQYKILFVGVCVM